MLNNDVVAPDWQPIVREAMTALPSEYLADLQERPWLPGPARALAAFELPLERTRFILFGEGPYPRAESATGHAFMDGAVGELWSETGLSKPVNRATSLRNLVKMLLLVRGDLAAEDLSQAAIARVDKTDLVQSLPELQANLHRAGVLLLNASLVFSTKARARHDARHWLPVMDRILAQLRERPVSLILWGKIAGVIQGLPSAAAFPAHESEHPYNLSFIHNPAMHDLFRPMDLLRRR